MTQETVKPSVRLRRANCRFCGGPITFVFTKNGRLRPADDTGGRSHSCTRYLQEQADASKAVAEIQQYVQRAEARGHLTWQTAIPRLRQPHN